MSNGINFGLPATDLGSSLAGIGRLLSLSSEQARKRELSAQLGSSIQGGNYEGAAKAAFDAGDADTGLGLLKLGQAFKKQQLEEKAGADFSRELGGAFGNGQGGSALGSLGQGMGQGSPDPSRALPSFADSSGPSGSYLANLTGRESNNNPNARNPNSTATGLGQFTEGTWNDLARRQPGLGLTPNGRTDPQQAMRATAAFTAENEALLTRAGLPVTDVTRYSMHFLGKQGGLRFLKGAEGNPDAPAASYADAASVRANRNVFFNRDGSLKTARQVLGDFNGSFAGGRRPGPVSSQVAYAGNENETQALESRMGMMPMLTAEADMPARGAREASFYIPGSEPNAPPAPPTRSPFGGTGGQGPAIEQSALGGRQAAGQGGGRVMSMPGGDGAPVAAGGLPGGVGPVAAGPGPSEAAGGSGGFPASGPLAQRIPVLLRASANPNLPEGQRQLAQTLLKSALDETKMSDAQKDYVLAKGQGFGGSFLDYQRELKRPGGPTKLSPGESVYDEGSNSIRITAPDRSRSNVADDVGARRASAAELGLAPGSPAYQSYVLTGKMPREDAQPLTAGDKKAIQDADTTVLSSQSTIDMLRQAKTLSKQAYEGPTAGFRGGVTSMFGNTAGVATADLDNLVTTQALQSLKGIFGGNPTEGERAILLEIQGSSSKPDVVRQRIYDRAIGLAELRMRQNQEKADELRGQTYYKPGSGPRGQDNNGSRGASPSSGRTLPAPSQDAVPAPDRFQQLMGSGLSKQQVYERLQQEGY